MYKIVEKVVSQVFQLKPEFSTENPPKRQTKSKIPRIARIIMRQRKQIVQKFKSAGTWQRKHKLMLELETKEKSLAEHYKERRATIENAAVSKLKKIQSTFTTLPKDSLVPKEPE